MKEKRKGEMKKESGEGSGRLRLEANGEVEKGKELQKAPSWQWSCEQEKTNEEEELGLCRKLERSQARPFWKIWTLVTRKSWGLIGEREAVILIDSGEALNFVDSNSAKNFRAIKSKVDLIGSLV